MQDKKPKPDLRDGKGRTVEFKVRSEPKKYISHTMESKQDRETLKLPEPINVHTSADVDITKKISLMPTDINIGRFLECVEDTMESSKSLARRKTPFFVKINTGAPKSMYGICIGKYYNMREVWHYRVITFVENKSNQAMDALRTNDYEGYMLAPVDNELLTKAQRESLVEIGKLEKIMNPKPGDIEEF